VTISGVMGGQPEINGTWVIESVNPSGDFTLPSGQITGNGKLSTGGKWTAQNTGIHIQKLPAGYNLIADSENSDVVSSYDRRKYSLASGGNRLQTDTESSGPTTKGSTEIKNVKTDIAKFVAPGMLTTTLATADGKHPLFTQGTYVDHVVLGTPG